MATGNSEGLFGYDLSHPDTATVWSADLNIQFTNNQHYMWKPDMGLIGPNQDYALCWDKELQANNGGKLHKTLHLALDHEGRTGAQTMEGFEAGFDEASFEYSIASYRGGVKVQSPLSQKLVAYDYLADWTRRLGEWAARREHYINLALLTGYTADVGSGWVDHTNRQIDVSKSNIWTRGNAIVAPATNFIYRGTSANSRATDEAVVPGDELDLATINKFDRLVRSAMSGRFPLRPPLKSSKGKEYYPWLIGAKTAETLRNDSGFQAIWNNLLSGGFIEDNPWFSNAFGSVGPFLFYVIEDMPPGVHSSTNAAVTTVERSVILGANAMSCSWTKGFGPTNQWKYLSGTRDGGYVKFLHLYSEGGRATTRWTDPKTSNVVEFKYVGTHYTG